MANLLATCKSPLLFIEFNLNMKISPSYGQVQRARFCGPQCTVNNVE